MGDNVYLGDRRGVRTPMQWSSDRNAGFSRADPAQLFSPVSFDPVYHYEAVNVEAQMRTPTSLLNGMRRLNADRKTYLVYVRSGETHTILCVVNLSRYVQPVSVDVRDFLGRTPVELIGEIPFPPISEAPYFLSLGPHTFFWFSLDPAPGSS